MVLQRLIVNSRLYSGFTDCTRETPYLHYQVGIIPPRRSGSERAPGGIARPSYAPPIDGKSVTITVFDNAYVSLRTGSAQGQVLLLDRSEPAGRLLRFA